MSAEWFSALSEDQIVEFFKAANDALEKHLAAFYAASGVDHSPQLAAQDFWFSVGAHVSNCGRCTNMAVKIMIAKLIEGAVVGTGK